MSLVNRAQADIDHITSNINDWGVEITLTAPTGEIALLNGLHTKHHLGVSNEGTIVNTKKAHVSFSENNLISANPNYPLRNNDSEVDLLAHKVEVKDSTGISKPYIVQAWFPDETIGLIVMTLDDFGTD